jgi:hypothetical protein
MTRMVFGATLVLGLLVGAVQTARGDSALIQTTAPLRDGSEDAVRIAVVTAIEKAMRGANAMGFAWVQLRGAQVLGHDVLVQILATDEPDDATEVDPDAEQPGKGGGLTGDRDSERAPQGATHL